MNLQDMFLNMARKDSVDITVFLVNGYQLKGTVKGFDNYTIILESEGKQQLIYKHAISTIVPSKTINYINRNIEQE
ncbi:RNA chaperone Hfq [Anaerosalibacter massiliensis]|uniref:RNA-binding protein Hfq n=2 Tax=Anaerosalibacter massiliensis TaxID=1347392 RepID=A0A9X2MK29_9FIRM|nr:RNA chaperone Hfq [Anaerosalibacter massiliensis]MCR2042696.1 RNA chaperone Hfq [Anaerosalibacter massiliensis]